MQVKKFEAPTLQEALDTIKRELGPEAIILQTKRHKRGFGLMSRSSVEVTAAVSERSAQKKQFAEARLGDDNRERLQRAPAERQAEVIDKMADRQHEKNARAADAKAKAARPLTPTRYADIDPMKASAAEPASAPRRASPAHSAPSGGGLETVSSAPPRPAPNAMPIEEEVRHLKRMLEELKSTQDEGAGARNMLPNGALSTPAMQDAFEQLVVSGVDKRFAFPLVKRAAFELGPERARNPEAVLDQLAAELMQSTEVDSPLSSVVPLDRDTRQGPIVLALVGPTGVGKTTTVAKLASEALLRRNLKVALVNLDSYKVAAFDQLGTYARILNVPFRSAGSAEELQAAIKDFHTLDLVIVDTTGRSQRDPGSLKEMQDILASVPGVRTHLVLAVTTRDTELYDMAARFGIFKPGGIIASKLDEATIYGSIYNVSQKTKLPLLYFTTGQRVPEDIEEATRERVAALILDL